MPNNILQGVPFFQNTIPQNVAVTLTFFSTIGQGGTAPIQNVPAGSTSGPTVLTIQAGQIITAVFDVGKDGGFLVNNGSNPGAAALVSYQVDDIDWG